MIDVTPEYAERFLRGGGRLSLAEWMGLTADARDAFAVAGDRIRRGLLAEIAGGLADGVEEARVADVLDLGVSLAARKLEEAP